MSWRHFTDKQWEEIKVHLPPRPPRPKGGRPPVDERKCFEGILWILWAGAPWKRTAERIQSPQHLLETTATVGTGWDVP